MPNEIHSCDKLPIGPLYSVGATSDKYFGQKTEKFPTDTPKMNLPEAIIIKSDDYDKMDPPITKKFVNKMHFHFPYSSNYPPLSAPIADPAIISTCI